jgi:hypothetical protein
MDGKQIGLRSLLRWYHHQCYIARSISFAHLEGHQNNWSSNKALINNSDLCMSCYKTFPLSCLIYTNKNNVKSGTNMAIIFFEYVMSFMLTMIEFARANSYLLK